MNQNSVDYAMRCGAPITCATCKYFHEGNMYCGQSGCGGPAAGRDFPNYDGPIPRNKFVERCLVCGVPDPTYRILLSINKTKFSLCDKHKHVYNHVGVPDGIIEHPVRIAKIKR